MTSASVRDPQAVGVRSAGPHDRRRAALAGLRGVEDVRQGKYSSSNSPRRSRTQARLAAEVADKLLANPVIESYRIEVD